MNQVTSDEQEYDTRRFRQLSRQLRSGKMARMAILAFGCCIRFAFAFALASA